MATACYDQRSTRYPLVLPALYAPVGRSRPLVGWTRNLSATGSCLVLPERFPLNQPLHLGVQTDSGLILAEGQVVWTKLSRFNFLRHGVAFTRMAPAHLRALVNLLAQEDNRPAGVRLAVALPVTCRCRRTILSPFSGWTGDLSRGGTLLYLSRMLPRSEEIVVTLHAFGEPLTLAGTVVWVDPVNARANRSLIRHGVQFNILDPAVDLALARLMALTPRLTYPRHDGSPRDIKRIAERSAADEVEKVLRASW